MAATTPFSHPCRTQYLTSYVPSGPTRVTLATPPSLFTPGEERESTSTKSPTLYADDAAAGVAHGVENGVAVREKEDVRELVGVGGGGANGGGGGITCCGERCCASCATSSAGLGDGRTCCPCTGRVTGAHDEPAPAPRASSRRSPSVEESPDRAEPAAGSLSGHLSAHAGRTVSVLARSSPTASQLCRRDRLSRDTAASAVDRAPTPAST